MNTPPQNEYLLLFRGPAWYNGLSPEELQKIMSQSKAWFDRLIARGKVKGGQPLLREGAVVSGRNGTVIDGPFAESKEAIGGYLLLQADSVEEAVAIARSSPSLAYGTTIEVRPVAEACPLDLRARQLVRDEQLASA
jgi:hypothetical protein